MVTVTVVGAQAVEERLARFATQFRPLVVEAVTRETIALQAHVVADKLSGQVLHVRSGTLRRSITERVEQTGAAVTGIVGTNLPYGRIHEYGGTIHLPPIVPVTAHALRFTVGGKTVFARRVKAHDVTIPARSYLRSALADRAAHIRTSLRGAVQAAFR